MRGFECPETCLLLLQNLKYPHNTLETTLNDNWYALTSNQNQVFLFIISKTAVKLEPDSRKMHYFQVAHISWGRIETFSQL